MKAERYLVVCARDNGYRERKAGPMRLTAPEPQQVTIDPDLAYGIADLIIKERLGVTALVRFEAPEVSDG